MKHLSSRPALEYFSIALLLTVTVILFAPGMTTAFSSDDYVHLNFNTDFANLLDASQVFSTTWGREYRPLVRISLWFNHLMGDTALPYKLTNLALHCLCSILAYLLLRRFKLGRTATFIGCAIFALHPIHVTSIQFILGRTDLLASVFYLTTLLLVTQWSDRPSA
jgi:hypothetical protein